jgi:hypothetical protein
MLLNNVLLIVSWILINKYFTINKYIVEISPVVKQISSKFIISLIEMLSISLITMDLTNNLHATKENNSVQSLGQLSFSNQTAACESENDTTLSCNNVALESNGNEGNNVVGQE